MSEHDGRVAFVTGGGSGIGRAAAELLASEGACVAVSDLDALRTETVAESINQAGGRGLAVTADVCDAAAISAAIDTTISAYGRLDIVVTAAGIQRYGTAEDTDEKVWDKVFAVNVKGVYLTARAALPQLRHSDAGSFVIVSSVQAQVSQHRVAAYAASKGALNALARSMAIDEAQHGVRVNAVCPGSVDTPMLRSSAGLFSDGSSEGIQRTVDEWGRNHPLGRVARPVEVAQVISFLASSRASFVTGEDIRVDGGLLAAIAVRAQKQEF
jgi:NAD(P)-dependent dehydrogenase (short-subunit alcohol dehydrogenase family)